jgi:spore coat protein U-like protein
VNRVFLLACLLAAAPLANAATVCRITALSGLAFGSYDILAAAPTDTQANIGVTCDRDGGPQNVTVEMGLDAGGGGSVSARRMTLIGGSDTLSYGLFSDIGRSSVWGSTSGINTVSRTLSVPNRSSASTTLTIYGRIPALQDVPAGGYADSVQITLSP